MYLINLKIVGGYTLLCVFCLSAHIFVKKGYESLCNQNLVHYYFMKDASMCVNLRSWIAFFEEICTLCIDMALNNLKTHMSASLTFMQSLHNIHKAI